MSSFWTGNFWCKKIVRNTFFKGFEGHVKFLNGNPFFVVSENDDFFTYKRVIICPNFQPSTLIFRNTIYVFEVGFSVFLSNYLSF